MRITADRISVGTGVAAALPPVSLEFASAEPAMLAVDTADRPTVLALAVSGRMRLGGGQVYVDGRIEPDRLRRVTAIVDAPTVAEPADTVSTRHIVHEELVISGQRANRAAVERLIGLASADDFADEPLGALPGDLRIRLLAETAASRPGVRALILTSPERHGGDPVELSRLIADLSDRGFAVLTLTSAAMVTAVGGTGTLQ
ncbi:hypothetical protein ACFSBZ_11030 [Amnibacterium flavum]|uniref:ABC transporter ATP-binding protein n=1 Tax=Amnibacterium flavum TaxID=2173173 RepID=A0A2V1HRZ0_9MICO|nr:hypothetical protein [Amnibacterium flavum]PVZ95363.1 hypothetical protein DDQ50_02255 [Amnibacterium flavum]